MRLSGSIKKFKPVILIILFTQVNFLLNGNVTNSIPASDSVLTSSDTSLHAVYVSAGYGSNMIYLGSTISQDQPFGYAALTYGIGSDLSVTVSANHLSGLNPFMAFYTGSVNYSHVFNSWLDISAGLYRYQVASSLADSLFSNFTYTDLTFGFDWKLLYTKVSAGGLFSDQNTVYLQMKNSRYFQTSETAKNKSFFSFDPYVNLLFGTFVEYETVTGTHIDGKWPVRNWKSKRQVTTTNTYSSSSFNIMEIDFGLPVAFNTKRLIIEGEACYVLPTYKNEGIPDPKGFIFLLSAYFRIF
jgi:hypothetical protein